jgi:hypothetical protein
MNRDIAVLFSRVIRKQYETSELEFHDSLLKGIEGSTKTLTRKLDNVIYVAQQLNAKFYPAVVMNAEEKPQALLIKEKDRSLTSLFCLMNRDIAVLFSRVIRSCR